MIGLSIAAMMIALAMLWIGHRHRTHRIAWLGNFADWLGVKFKRPSWVALPVLVFTTFIICALFGFIWDVSWHIGEGRDPGPLANPAHYFIIIGLFGIFLAGMIAVVLPFDKPGPAPVRITKDWHAPVGGVLMAGCGLYALIGFPLDDIWHRLFGQDVTLWGPTHLMMIGGACFSLFAVLMLEYEGGGALPDAPADRPFVRFLRYLSCGGLLIGLSVYQIEYDFGVEQFRLVLQPMMIAGVAALGLVVARMTLGKGAAIIAALFAILLRGVVAFLVGPVLGAPINWFPLYLGPALVVEAVALTPLFKRPVVFGAVAGLGVGTVGLWLESLWIGTVYHYPWPTSMWGEALAMAVPVAVLMGVCGGLLGMVLTGQRLPRRAIGISVVVMTVLVIGATVANGLHIVVPKQDTATITLTDLPGEPGKRMVSADVQLNPANMVSDNPDWLTILSWQGGMENRRGLVIDRLERVGPGHYRSTQPIPVWGKWKTLLRAQDGYTMTAVPIWEPADDAIPAAEVPALANSTRPFVQEITILQRERDQNAPVWLFNVGSIVVLIFTLMVIAGITWGAGRINGGTSRPRRTEDAETPLPRAA
ncbi:hypothetical protein Mkiyose1665_44580 [Mycobacterium kiyosense]|uniref:Uncharacterized protein n=1 Tax=Mycobacterium kiyosense TaxID=2871094 RepID=A0A9P3Q917_9MYCO|nr:hypothetical protein IWGMT90018_33660 [Mycobacterium kiyosense]BDE13849.1 hypothetical protein MKCMC460_27090 [Mycobacterium sp. 20KCMC460]GLB83738.1 hypothetical protein SRL2020028_29940 [Mycobacterium kiyosense]GLB91379.1 hypothetical protein SRL2020130_41960 [Mycobacterium kiyosense]GLB97254.1 hypothetical protein SRL2020226_40300 [Mycobacterium kiyosense]